jgi:arsenate reductase
MAEAFLRRYAGDQFDVYSAGLEPEPIHPYVYKVMREVGLDLDGHYPKDVAGFLGKVYFGYLITVCARAEEKCPIFPGLGQRLFWPLDDPVEFEGAEEDKLEVFRKVRDQIEERILAWLAKMKENIDSDGLSGEK